MAQILLRNAQLLDTDTGHTLPGHSVLVDEDRIVEVREGEIDAAQAQTIEIG
ncbi:MAG: amidohydrolase family protein, partial [Acidobacteria bacterium]|nr:amidohydrolase family protein [Candidatus Sulfomarinibacter sp. MAG AM1]